MKQQIRLTESELHRLITEAVMEYMDEDWNQNIQGITQHGRGFINSVGGLATDVVNAGKQGLQQGYQNVKQGVQQGVNNVKQGAQQLKQGAQGWAQLNQRVSRIEKQLGLAESKQRSIDDIVNEAINRYIR